MSLDSLVFDPKSDPGSSKPDGRVAYVLSLGHHQGESIARAERRAPTLRAPNAQAIFDREDERRRIELKGRRRRRPMRRGRAE
jgi:hypothetical protein